MMAPNMPMALKKATATEIANWLWRKRSNGTTGCCAQRVSTRKNATSITPANASRPSTSGEVQEWSLVIERPTRSGITPAARVAVPRKSISRQVALERT